ncbi:MAG: YHS domain-containing protein [Candidatus Nanoarchaeia archaeon]
MKIILLCPVCGVEVKERKSGYEYKGKIYFCCSSKCKAKFKSNPKEYAV